MGDWLRLYYRLLSHQPEFSLKRKFKMRRAAEKAKNSVCLITLFRRCKQIRFTYREHCKS